MDIQMRKSVRKILKKDKRMERLKRSFEENSMYNLPFEDIKDELKLLHKTRTINQLDVRSPTFVDKLSTASVADHSFRSRITEILVECAGVNSMLKRTLTALEDYILNEYANELKPLRTKDERRVFVASILEPYVAYLSGVQELVEICKYYLDCLDKGGFMSRDLVSAYSLVRKYEPS